MLCPRYIWWTRETEGKVSEVNEPKRRRRKTSCITMVPAAKETWLVTLGHDQASVMGRQESLLGKMCVDCSMRNYDSSKVSRYTLIAKIRKPWRIIHSHLNLLWQVPSETRLARNQPLHKSGRYQISLESEQKMGTHPTRLACRQGR